MRDGTRFDVEIAGLALEDADRIGRGPEAGKPLGCFLRRERLHVETVLPGTGQDSGDESSFGPADLEQADVMEECTSAAGFQFVPEFVGPQDQRHVIRMLVVGLADDTSLAVRAAAVVAGRKAIETEHASPASRQMIEGRAADAAGAHDDHVIT